MSWANVGSDDGRERPGEKRVQEENEAVRGVVLDVQSRG